MDEEKTSRARDWEDKGEGEVESALDLCGLCQG